MKKMFVYLFVLGICLSSNHSLAQNPKQSSAEHHPFGLGVIAGVPTGITAKFNIDNAMSIDGGIGWATSHDDKLHVYGSCLYHLYHLIKVPKGRLPVYFGGGLRFLSREHKDDKFGVRIPAGIEYQFEDLPLRAFAEIVPVLNLTPDTNFDLEGGIGIRFFF